MNLSFRPALFTRISFIGGLVGAMLPAAGQNFDRMADQLDTDGDFFAYVDLSGDMRILGDHLTEIYTAYLQANPEAMPIPLDFASIFQQLGFDGIQALGYSSAPLGDDIWRNRSVALLEGEPSGLLKLYDLSPRQFRAAEIAPEDATMAIDLTLNLGVLRDTVAQIATSVMGPMGQGMIMGGLQQPLLPSGLTGDDLVGYLSHPITFVARQSFGAEMEQSFEFYVEVAGAAALVNEFVALAEGNPEITVEDSEGGTLVDLSSFVTEANMGLFAQREAGSDQLVMFTSAEFRDRVGNGGSLADSAEFQRLASHLPETAGGFTYQKSTLSEDLLRMLRDKPEMQPYLPLIEVAMERLVGDFLEPQASAFYSIDEGMVADSYANFSAKEALAVVPAALVGGAVAAVHSFQQVQTTSQEKAVTNNLRQFASAAQQYMLDEGVNEVTYDDIVGPDKYIEELEPVAGESYEDLIITAEDSVVSVQLADGRVISYRF